MSWDFPLAGVLCDGFWADPDVGRCLFRGHPFQLAHFIRCPNAVGRGSLPESGRYAARSYEQAGWIILIPRSECGNPRFCACASRSICGNVRKAEVAIGIATSLSEVDRVLAVNPIPSLLYLCHPILITGSRGVIEHYQFGIDALQKVNDAVCLLLPR